MRCGSWRTPERGQRHACRRCLAWRPATPEHAAAQPSRLTAWQWTLAARLPAGSPGAAHSPSPADSQPGRGCRWGACCCSLQPSGSVQRQQAVSPGRMASCTTPHSVLRPHCSVFKPGSAHMCSLWLELGPSAEVAALGPAPAARICVVRRARIRGWSALAVGKSSQGRKMNHFQVARPQPAVSTDYAHLPVTCSTEPGPGCQQPSVSFVVYNTT